MDGLATVVSGPPRDRAATMAARHRTPMQRSGAPNSAHKHSQIEGQPRLHDTGVTRSEPVSELVVAGVQVESVRSAWTRRARSGSRTVAEIEWWMAS